MELVNSIVKAVKILDMLGKKGPLSFNELLRLYELPKSTLSKILHTLESEELIRKEAESNKYHLGSKLIELGSAARTSLEIRNICRPIMTRLHEKVGLTAHLGIIAHGEVLPIESVESGNWYWHHFKYPVAVGISAPMYATGAGKAILAFLKPEEIDQILSQDLIKFTESTKTDKASLLEELQLIRKLGYAVSNAEHDEMVRSVAAPVFNSDGKVIASVSVLGLSSKITSDKIQEISLDVMAATHEISHLLGFQSNKKISFWLTIPVSMVSWLYIETKFIYMYS